jgi:hypothetical protein
MWGLIWVGNTLLPRWFVFSIVALIVIILVSIFTWLTR